MTAARASSIAARAAQALFQLQEHLKGHNSAQLRRELEHSQWWQPAMITELQLQRLRVQLLHAGQHVPYYRKLFARIGFDPHAVHDLRDWTHDRHRTVDDTPYGGGAGMVMKPEPWGEALAAVLANAPSGGTERRPTLVVPTPSGRPFTQAVARELATRDHLVLACGRYEGIDQRVVDDAA